MSFEELPRDVMIKVMQHSDMETRVKAGMIHRLKIPDFLTRKLDVYINQRLTSLCTNIIIIPISQRKHYECYYDQGYDRYFWYFVDATNTHDAYEYPDTELLYPKLKLCTPCV